MNRVIVMPEAFAAAAHGLIGAPYRLHGRDAASGLDCVGVVQAALARCGCAVSLPATYGLRNSGIARFLPMAATAGFACVGTSGQNPGDIVCVRPGPAQWHLAIAASRDLFIHAHAGLRRVVAQPAPLPWPVAMRWRISNFIEG